MYSYTCRHAIARFTQIGSQYFGKIQTIRNVAQVIDYRAEWISRCIIIIMLRTS